MVPTKLYGISNINDPGRETWKTSAMISQAFKILRVSNLLATEKTASLAMSFLIENTSVFQKTTPEKKVLTSLSHSLWMSIYFNIILLYKLVFNLAFNIIWPIYCIPVFWQSAVPEAKILYCPNQFKNKRNKKIKFQILSTIFFYECTFFILKRERYWDTMRVHGLRVTKRK